MALAAYKGVKKKRERQMLSIQEGIERILDKKGGKDRLHLNELWKNWDAVMGDYLASLGSPLGHKNGVILVGADDSMALQELSMQSYEILERANAFMDTAYFLSVRAVLLQGKRSLSKPAAFTPPKKKKKSLPFAPPPRLGGLVGKLDPDSPITQCYEAYVQFFTRYKE